MLNVVKYETTFYILLTVHLVTNSC